MEISLKFSTLLFAIVFTGMSAGLCFTWTNAITPGIGKLNDLGFLKSFQEMNRTLLNPLFFTVFFGPFFLNLINLYLFKDMDTSFIWLLIIATVLYFLGVVIVTIAGNVPLNELLDKTDLTTAIADDLKQLRETFEVKWKRLHLIRTITSMVSFIVLLFSLINFIKTK
jgi:uncharacterized membrane protein